MATVLAMAVHEIVHNWIITNRILALCKGMSAAETIEFARAYMKTGGKSG